MSVSTFERTRKIKKETGTSVATGACPANTMGWEATARARPALADELRAETVVRKSLVFRAPAFVFQCPSCHGGLGVFLYFVAGSWCDALS